MKLTLRILFVVAVFLGAGLYFVSTQFEKTDPLPDPIVVTEEEEPSVDERPQEQPAVIAPPIVQEVTVSASGAYSLLDGEAMHSFRTNKRWPIASITKLMATIVANEFIPGDETIVITEEILETYGDSGGLELGEEYTVNDLIMAMMLVSSNDAAHALALHFGEEDFVSEMNLLADKIGMTNTTFVDSTGLSPQNLSTVEDLYLLGKYVWENEKEILSITRQKSATIREVNTGIIRQLININAFAGRVDFLGGKTGQLPQSGGNLLSLFLKPVDNEPIVIVVLGAGDRFLETTHILEEL